MKPAALSALSALLLATPGISPAQDAETARLLKEVEAIRELLDSSSGKNNERALSAIRAALTSPKATYEFYMDSVKEVDFDQEGRRESDWREWRDSNEERLRSGEHIQARQLQLRYLALSISAAGGAADDETLAGVMPELIAYLDTMTASAVEFEEHRRVLDRSVLESVFGKRLKLNLSVDSKLPWVYSPLQVAPIYDNTVMPFYRRAKDARGLASAWDRRIVHESKIAALPELGDDGRRGWRRGEDDRDREREERREDARTSKRGEQRFVEERLPELKWGKAKDALEYGDDRMAALRAMTGVVRSNLGHRNARKWLDEIIAHATGGAPLADAGEGGDPAGDEAGEGRSESTAVEGGEVSLEPAVAEPGERFE